MNLKRWSWTSWITILLVIGAICFSLIVYRGGSIRSKSKRVYVGMTKQQVEAVMGKVRNSYKGKRTPDRRSVLTWDDDDGSFDAYFDENGILDMKLFYQADNLNAKVRSLVGTFLD